MGFRVPPGGGPPAHRRPREDEVLQIRAGIHRFWMDGACFDAGSGAVVFLPKGHPHRDRNVSDRPGGHALTAVPAGLKRSSSDVERPRLEAPRDFAALDEPSARDHGLEYLPG